jgi:hypothetical protein
VKARRPIHTRKTATAMNEYESEKPNSKFASLELSDSMNVSWALSRRQESFPDRKSAIKFSETQTRLWRALFNTLLEKKVDNQIVSALLDSLDQAHFDAPEAGPPYSATARIPLMDIHRLALLQDIASHDPDLVAAAVFIECAEITPAVKIQTLSVRLLGAMISYASGGITTRDLTSAVAGFQSKMDSATSGAQASAQKLQTDFEQFVKSETDKLVSFKESLSEELKLKSANDLWKDRARWHRLAAIIYFILFGSLVLGVLLFGLWNFTAIVKELPKDSAGHIEYAGLALLGIAALGIGWCLKLLARFVHTNSILGDDSRQRQAMTRTYLSLVADKESQVTKEDRIIMLNAIFRPLHGSQNDEVAPPTILDLMKRGGS